MAGLDRAAGDTVRAGHRCRVRTHRIFLADLAQVEVVLEQLPQQVPAPRGQQVLQLGMPQPGGRFGAQLHGQSVEHTARSRERIGGGLGGNGMHRRFSIMVGGVDTANATATGRPPTYADFSASVPTSMQTRPDGCGGRTGPPPARPASHA